jgi:hypothetical protein
MNFELSETSHASIIPQTVTVLVDSRERDPETNPHAHTYRVHLPAPLRDVTAARVVSAEIPDTVYTFSATDGNTSLNLTIAGESRSITIPDGRYTVETLCTAVESVLNQAFDSVDIGVTVTLDPASRRVTIEAPSYPNVPIHLQTSVEKNDLAWYLGFRRETTGTGQITSQEAATTNVEHYVYMHVRNMDDNIECGNTGKVFAKIPRKETDAYDVTFYDRLITKNRLNPAMAKISWLDIQWTQYDGQPIRDMGEHAVTLEFWCSVGRNNV